MGANIINVSQVAWSTPFETDIDRGNGFPDTIPNVQEAIEYAKLNAEGFPRAGLPLVMNSTVSDGDWISYSNLTPTVPIPFATKTKINEIT
jgi:hypothetical protein